MTEENKNKNKVERLNMTKIITYTAVTVALTTAGAYVRIPFYPAPLTLQTLFSVLSGAVLGYKYGPLSQFIYITLGLAGLPVFASGGGIAYVFSPTFGYLLGFALCSFVTGLILHILKLKYKRVKTFAYGVYFAACLIGMLCVYITGVPYLFVILNVAHNVNVAHKELSYFLTSGFLYFIPGDILKAAAAAAVIKLLNSRINYQL